MFFKTFRILIDCVLKVVILFNKEGDTFFYCLVKIVFDCIGEFEKISIYEGYFAVFIKELAYLKIFGKFIFNVVKEFLFKRN